MLEYLKTHCLLQGMYHQKQQQNKQEHNFFLKSALGNSVCRVCLCFEMLCPGRWLDHVKYLLPQCHKSVAGVLVLSLPVLVLVQSILALS